MTKKLPKNPEVYFKSTPNEFSDASRIIEIKTSEYRSGIVLDNLAELEKTLVLYISDIRNIKLGSDKKEEIVRRTMKEINKAISIGNEKKRENYKGRILKIREDFDSLIFLPQGYKKRVLTDMEDLLNKEQNLYSGNIYPVSIFAEFKGFNDLKSEISIDTTKGKFVFALKNVSHDPRQFESERDRILKLEERIAKELGKELSINSTHLDLVMSIVDGAWYNIPLYNLLKDVGFKFKGSLSQQGKSIPLSRKIYQQRVEGVSGRINDHYSLILKHNRHDFYVFLNIEADVGSGKPKHITDALENEDLDEEIKEELKRNKYAQVRGDDIVGPAWNTFERKYGKPKTARLKLPVLKFNFYFNEAVCKKPIVERKIMENLVDSRDIVISKLEKYR